MATNKIPTMLRLPEELHNKVKILSSLEHRSMNMEIEYALTKYIFQYEEEHGTINLPNLSE
ncbi:MAG: Arc family DNA-binding protein [Eubacterium sp.]|nr:Arc family DNA-binding protein [Eubacterium sp.]